MRVRYFLRDKKAKSETAIYALVSYEGERVKIPIGESIKPSFFNQKTNLVRITSKFPEGPEFNERLSHLSSLIKKAMLTYKNENDGQSPSPEVFKARAEAYINRKPVASVAFLQYFENFVNRTKAGQRINPRSKKAIKESGSRGYNTTFEHLKAFSETKKVPLNFDSITLDFYNAFTTYLAEKPRSLSLNTIGSHIQRIKAVMSEAVEQKLTKNMDFRSKSFVKVSEDADNIYLNYTELNEMEGLDLSDDLRLDRVRDLFLIGAYTGLRFSDFSVLKPENIADGFISIAQVKTGSPVVIPVHKVVKRILEKYNGGVPAAISNVKMNLYLKEVGKKMESLKVIESKRMTKGGSSVFTQKLKWEMLSSHTARRSFATNQYKDGVQSLTIMAITGHRSEGSFRRYLKITPNEHAVKLKQMWDDKEKKDTILKVV